MKTLINILKSIFLWMSCKRLVIGSEEGVSGKAFMPFDIYATKLACEILQSL